MEIPNAFLILPVQTSPRAIMDEPVPFTCACDPPRVDAKEYMRVLSLNRALLRECLRVRSQLQFIYDAVDALTCPEPPVVGPVEGGIQVLTPQEDISAEVKFDALCHAINAMEALPPRK